MRVAVIDEADDEDEADEDEDDDDLIVSGAVLIVDTAMRFVLISLALVVNSEPFDKLVNKSFVSLVVVKMIVLVAKCSLKSSALCTTSFVV
jgi:hypothetical protein